MRTYSVRESELWFFVSLPPFYFRSPKKFPSSQQLEKLPTNEISFVYAWIEPHYFETGSSKLVADTENKTQAEATAQTETEAQGKWEEAIKVSGW